MTLLVHSNISFNADLELIISKHLPGSIYHKKAKKYLFILLACYLYLLFFNLFGQAF